MKRVIFILSLFLLATNYSFSQSKIEKAQESLHKKSDTKSSSNRGRSNQNNSRSSSSSSSYDSGGNDLIIELVAVFGEVILYASYYTLIETPAEYDGRAYKAAITKYPYYNSAKGNYSYNEDTTTGTFRTTISNRYIRENSRSYGNHLNADFRFLKRLGLEADYLQLWEEHPFFGDNSLALVTVLAKYHRVRTEKFSAYWGLGATYVGGDVEKTGAAYGIGAELFFAKPLSIASNFNQSFINSRSINKVNVLLNYHIKRFKLTGGYEYLNIGGVNFSTLSTGVGASF